MSSTENSRKRQGQLFDFREMPPGTNRMVWLRESTTSHLRSVYDIDWQGRLVRRWSALESEYNAREKIAGPPIILELLMRPKSRTSRRIRLALDATLKEGDGRYLFGLPRIHTKNTRPFHPPK